MVGALIGQGSFGSALCGRHKAPQKQAAVKAALRRSTQGLPSLVHATRQEQAIFQRCHDSPRIKSLHASLHGDERLYFVLELCTLLEVLCNMPLTRTYYTPYSTRQ